MGETLGYSEVDNEIVDNNSAQEKEIIDEVNKSLEEGSKLTDNQLENLNQTQLASFLNKTYFEGGVKSYAECKKTGKFLNFSMKAALQLLSKDDTQKYDETGNTTSDENGKTINDLIKNNGGLDLDEDSTLIKILQSKVGAEPDGKPGPQTIALVINALGGDTSTIGESVDTFYQNNEKFKVSKTTTINDVEYKHSPSIKVNTKGDGTYIGDTKITFNGETPVCEGYTFENGRIKKVNTTNNSGTENQEQPKQGAENKEDTPEQGKKVVELWNKLYKVTIPDINGLSLEKNKDNNYDMKYKGNIIGNIELNNGGVATAYCTNKSIFNYAAKTDNSVTPHTIDITFPEKKTIKYYNNTFVLDYGLCAHLPNNGTSSLNFQNEYGSYCGFLNMNSDGSVPTTLSHSLNTHNHERNIEIKQDEKNPTIYYANYKA